MSLPLPPARPLPVSRHPARWRIISAVCVLLLTPPAAPSAPVERAPRLEYQVKAGYLFNFLRFTEWPPESLPDGAPFRIGVLEDAATAAIIADSLRGKKIDGHAIEVEVLETSESIGGLHLLFVPRTASTTRPVVPSKPVLIVGERSNYAVNGGMIGFVLRGYNIRFQVNLAAAQQAGLKLSARLAGLAEIVEPLSP